MEKSIVPPAGVQNPPPPVPKAKTPGPRAQTPQKQPVKKAISEDMLSLCSATTTGNRSTFISNQTIRSNLYC